MVLTRLESFGNRWWLRLNPHLKTEGCRHKIVITVDAKSHDLVDAYVCSVEMLTQAFFAQMHPLPADTISSIVSLMVPKKPVPSTLLREARMLAQANTEILQSHDWVTANEISNLAQFRSANPSSQPKKWKPILWSEESWRLTWEKRKFGAWRCRLPTIQLHTMQDLLDAL